MGFSLGAFAAGAANAGSRDIEARRATALELKMKSSLLAQSHADSMEENVQKDSLARASASAKYKEEDLLPKGMGAEFADEAGMTVPAENLQQAKLMGELAGRKIMAQNKKDLLNKHMESLHDPMTGLKISDRVIDENTGTVVRDIPDKTYGTKLARYNVINKYTLDLANLSGTYDRLNAAGAVGPVAGRIRTKLGGYSADVDTMNKLSESVTPLALQSLDIIPGGRASILGAKIAGKYVVSSTTTPQVKQNIVDNAAFNLYKEFKTMDATVPEWLAAKFKDIPKHENGVPIDVYYMDGKAYPAGSMVALDLKQSQPQQAAQGPDRATAEDQAAQDYIIKLRNERKGKK